MPLTRRRDGDESRRRLSVALVISTVVHLVVLALLLRWVMTMMIVPKGNQHRALQTTLTLEQRIQPSQQSQPKPAAAAPAPARPQPHPVPVPQAPPHHELAKLSPTAPPQPPAAPRTALQQRLASDQSRFGREVASLNKGDDVHISPTIAPGGGGGDTKSYAFQPPGGGEGSRFGNGVISPTRHWVDKGDNCYYGRYELEYSDGASEDGDIPWPFCYAPADDPFLRPPHPIPFPLPLPGYVLPAGTALTPIERDVYDHWSGAHG
jgi:hypothetical protein